MVGDDPVLETSGDGDGDGDGDEVTSVLLIGDIYTAANNLPLLLATLADSAPSKSVLEVEALTDVGTSVADYDDDPELLAKLEQSFDVVVIQSNASDTIMNAGFAQSVVDLTALTGDARVVLFQTWPYAGGFPLLDMTREQMYDAIASGYFDASVASGAEIARVGAAWMSVLDDAPWIELYAGDSVPSLSGSYLAACVLFGKITQTSASASAWSPDGISDAHAELLRAAADVANEG